MSVWTEFHDMHSGGGLKEPPYGRIYIEAPQAEAEVIFYNRFGHSPGRVTCTCCGQDYAISESPSLAQASAYERGCHALETPRVKGLYRQPDDAWWKAHYYVEPDEHDEAEARGWKLSDMPVRKPYRTVAEYITDDTVYVLRAADIPPEHRLGTVPEEGYVWR